MYKKPDRNLQWPFRLLVFIILLFSIYLLNCFTPLRLTNDTIRYLHAAEWMENGLPPNAAAASDFLPYGYSGLLFLLFRLHLLHPFIIAFINELYLFGALYFIVSIFGECIRAAELVILVLLSWLTIKFSITPLSEMQFLFFSSGALYFYNRYHVSRGIRSFLLAVLFFIAAILTRTIGIAIFIAVCVSMLYENRHSIRQQFLQRWKLFLVLLAGVLVIFYFLQELKISDYLFYFLSPLYRHGAIGFYHTLCNHFYEFADVFINTPSSKINIIPDPLRMGIYTGVGILMLFILVYLISRNHIKAPLFVKCYLIVYMLIIFSWPFFDSRFWLPVFPFLIAILLQAATPQNLLARVFIKSAKLLYLSMGVFALSYYTYTSFNKKALAIKQDTGQWRNEYEIHFFQKTLSDTAIQVNSEVLRLLKKVD